MNRIDRAERFVRRLGGVVAIAAAAFAVPGVVRSAFQSGPESGRPNLVFTSARLLAISLGARSREAVRRLRAAKLD